MNRVNLAEPERAGEIAQRDVDGGRQPAFSRIEVAGSEPDEPPCQRHDHEDHRDRDEQPAKNEADHEAGDALVMSGMP